MVRFNFRWALFLAVFALSSIYFFVFGESGILERMSLQREKTIIEGRINALKDENRDLARSASRYRRGQYSADDYRDSGYIRPGDKVLLLPRAGIGPTPKRSAEREKDPFPGILPYLRIIWVALSVGVVASLFLYNRKVKSRELP